jgi:protein-tyrosine phosphatase
MIDLHTHLLPGVDDGAQDLEEALAMCAALAADGITVAACTPHYPPAWFGRRQWLLESVDNLSHAVRQAGIDLQIEPGAEIPLLPEALARQEELPRLGRGSRALLLEVPLHGVPPFLEEVVFSFQLAGVLVVLAHPERSRPLPGEVDIFLRLAERGAYLQLTATSFTGDYGRPVQRLAERFLREAANCLISTDTHDLHARPPRLSHLERRLSRLTSSERFEEVVLHNPQKVLSAAPL